ncbi:MAG: hypothetical protein MUF02_06615 [Acidobacteria bacterium]|nr:hypothetical protein [Acidobacteriota bacterium]
MKTRWLLPCAFFLALAWPLSISAEYPHNLSVAPAGPVKPGDVLVFTAHFNALGSNSVSSACQGIDWQSAGVGYYVRTPAGYDTPTWNTEVFHTTLGGAVVGTSHVFTATYMVPLMFGNQTIVFELHGNGMCIPGPLTDATFAGIGVVVHGPNRPGPKLRIPVLDCFPEPGCPLCLRLSLEKINAVILPGLRERVEVRLVQSGRLVAVLGQAAPGLLLPQWSSIRLNEADMALLRRLM